MISPDRDSRSWPRPQKVAKVCTRQRWPAALSAKTWRPEIEFGLTTSQASRILTRSRLRVPHPASRPTDNPFEGDALMASRRFPVGLILVLTFCGLMCAQTPGQNSNMVSGTQFPGGDQFLQRQNEPSLAISTRNPRHILAGANDYRTVDLPANDALPDNEVTGDAWLGVFKSFDGGQT